MIWRIFIIAMVLGITAMFFFGLGRDPRYIPSPLVGKEAPSFETVTLAGEPWSSDEIKGKVALVTFWATWCTTCTADEPQFMALQRRFGDRDDFAIVGVVTQDTADKAQRYLDRGGRRPYLNLFDESGHLAIDFGVYGVPESYLIDQEGNIVRKMAGPIPLRVLLEEIEELLSADVVVPGETG